MNLSWMNVVRSTAVALLIATAVLLGSVPPFGPVFSSAGFTVSYADPGGDAFGPGNYSYSTAFSDAYRAEYFDLRNFSVQLESDILRVSVSFTEIANPYESPLGFSPQVIHVYITGECDLRRTDTLGLNVKLRAVDAWCVAIIIAPNLGNQTPRVVFSDGRIEEIYRVYVSGNTIAAELPAELITGNVGGDPTKWRYFVAVSAYDPHSPDGLIRISSRDSETPVFYKNADLLTLKLLPRLLDMLAETADDQYSMLKNFSPTHGDVATVAAYPYAEGLLLPPMPSIEIFTYTVTKFMTETYIKVYTISGATATTTAYVQVPKYGLELYALAFMSAFLVVVLAAVLRKVTITKKIDYTHTKSG